MSVVRASTFFTLLAVTALGGCSRPSGGTLESSAQALGVADISSLEFSGSGRWFQFGQSPNPTAAWPQFEVSNYQASFDYATPAARVQITRLQSVEPGRERPAPAEQKPDQYVSGTYAWNLATPAGAAPGSAPTAQPQSAALEERIAEIWTTPHGFLKAALANGATSKRIDDKSEVTLTLGKNRFVGTINANDQVERVQTWIDNPVLGDTLVEFTYADYKDFGGTQFPSRIVRTQGGHPVLELTVSAVTPNAPVAILVPEEVQASTEPSVNVTAEQLASGVNYLKGGSHHSVAIEQRDHIVVVEAPQHEARSLAVIAKVRELIPNKPIKYLINTHHHFDHSGGLRTYVDEGVTIVTHEANKPYYEQAWKNGHTLNPDRLAASQRPVKFATFTDKHVLSDGDRTIEVHTLTGNGHNDAFALVYLPKEKLVIEADAYTPTAPDAPRPTAANPYSVNLYDTIERLKLDVTQIAALHGPRVATLADLRAAILRGE